MLGIRPRLTGKRDRCRDGKAFDITVNLLLLCTFFLCGYLISERANGSFSAIRNSSFKIPKKDTLDNRDSGKLDTLGQMDPALAIGGFS